MGLWLNSGQIISIISVTTSNSFQLFHVLSPVPPGHPTVDYEPTEMLQAGLTFTPICSAHGVPLPALQWTWEATGVAIPSQDIVGMEIGIK